MMSSKEFYTIRTSLGLTQIEMAKIMNCQRNTVSRYETGESRIMPMVERFVRMLAQRGTKSVEALETAETQEKRSRKKLSLSS